MSLFNRRSDLPLRGDATSRYLPWLVAPMVFLSAVALAGAFILNGLISRWDKDVSGTLTVEISALSSDGPDSDIATRRKTDQLLALLRATTGVKEARALTNDQLVALLAPWLGGKDLLRDLPLPALIDVTIEDESALDIELLGHRIEQAVPGASLDDHRRWLARLIGLSRSIEWLAIGIVWVIGLVTAATVHYATRTGLAIHRDVIEVLHVIGAPDGYIAGQFAHRALVLGFRGGLLGLALTLPILAFIGFGAHRLEGGFLADLSLPLSGLLAVLALPLAAALLAMLTARAAVYGALARLP